MPAPQVHLDLADAAELGEMLTFISQWLGGTDPPHARAPIPPPTVHPHLAAPAELGEMLTFISQWLGGTDHAQLGASFGRFIGTPGYDLAQLRPDLARLTFLLAPPPRRHP